MSETLVRLEREGHVATVTLARPAKLNSLTPAMLDQLERCARDVEADESVRAVVLAAEGDKAFCVGADINEWAALAPLDMWRRCVESAYNPDALYARYAHQQAHTFRRRLRYPVDLRRLAPRSIWRGLGIFSRIFWRIGVQSDYRRAFWWMAWQMLGSGRFEQFVHSAVVSYHLIEFARECVLGRPEPSFYAPSRTLAPIVETAPTVRRLGLRPSSLLQPRPLRPLARTLGLTDP